MDKELYAKYLEGILENDDLETYGPIGSDDIRPFPQKTFLFMASLTDLIPRAERKLDIVPEDLRKLLEEDDSNYFILAPAFDFPVFPAQAPAPMFFRIMTQTQNFFCPVDPVSLIQTMSNISKREKKTKVWLLGKRKVMKWYHYTYVPRANT